MPPKYEYEPDAKPTELESLCKAFGIRRHPETLFAALGALGIVSLRMTAGSL